MQTKNDSQSQIPICWHSASPSALLISVQLFVLKDMKPDKEPIEEKGKTLIYCSKLWMRAIINLLQFVNLSAD